MNDFDLTPSESTLERERIRLIAEVTENAHRIMRHRKVTKTDLARRLGKSPSMITKLLRGDHNFTVSTLSNLFAVLGCSLHIVHEPIGARCSVWELSPPNSQLLESAPTSPTANSNYALAA